jgi:DNA helicase-2/ATP-dependent DNA helicase PcrA
MGGLNTHDPLLEDLTEPQQAAVTCTEGPLLVLAAAGSGKTRVITRRAAFLLRSCGIPPWQVLCITFTNKAAGEMRQRIAALVGDRDAGRMVIGTFHALCCRLLRQYHEAAGVSRDFAIFDSADQTRALKQAFKDLDISTQNFEPAAIKSTISNAKNQLIDAEAFAKDAADFFSRSVAKLYRKYEEILTRSKALDFDDLLLKTAKLLQSDERVRSELQQRFMYVLVDEYQDTNHAQFVIAHCLAAGHGNICVVGDPDQSIYGWRGANIANILEFEKHYPAAKIITLGQNYRSTPQILLAADTLIRCNKKRRHKDLFTANPNGESVRVKQLSDEEQEAKTVSEFLHEQNRGGIQWGEMGVFYRVNALSRVLEGELMKSSIPYQVARGTAFYQRAEVKDAMAYVRLIANPDDEVSLLRVINVPTRGIGETTITHMQAFAVANGWTFWEALRRVSQASAVAGRAAASIRSFTAMIEEWRGKVASTDPLRLGFIPGARDLVEMVLRDSGLEKFYKDPKTEDEQKLANLYELVTAAQSFDEGYENAEATLEQRLRDWLENVALVSDVDSLEADESGGAVTLMTLHAAKGLEFQAVAMVGLEEGLLPHSRARSSPSELEEERRLCFVGITRAEKQLLMTHARYRTIRGLRERTIPSPFLKEIGTAGVVYEDLSGFETSPWDRPRNVYDGGDHYDETRETPRSDADDSQGHGLSVGAMVKHPQFGSGRVMDLSPQHAPTRAKVYFQRFGAKTLVLEYARLEIVE